MGDFKISDNYISVRLSNGVYDGKRLCTYVSKKKREFCPGKSGGKPFSKQNFGLPNFFSVYQILKISSNLVEPWSTKFEDHLANPVVIELFTC